MSRVVVPPVTSSKPQTLLTPSCHRTSPLSPKWRLIWLHSVASHINRSGFTTFLFRALFFSFRFVCPTVQLSQFVPLLLVATRLQTQHFSTHWLNSTDSSRKHVLRWRHVLQRHIQVPSPYLQLPRPTYKRYSMHILCASLWSVSGIKFWRPSSICSLTAIKQNSHAATSHFTTHTVPPTVSGTTVFPPHKFALQLCCHFYLQKVKSVALGWDPVINVVSSFVKIGHVSEKLTFTDSVVMLALAYRKRSGSPGSLQSGYLMWLRPVKFTWKTVGVWILWQNIVQSRCSWLIWTDKTVTNFRNNFQCKAPIWYQDLTKYQPLRHKITLKSMKI